MNLQRRSVFATLILAPLAKVFGGKPKPIAYLDVPFSSGGDKAVLTRGRITWLNCLQEDGDREFINTINKAADRLNKSGYWHHLSDPDSPDPCIPLSPEAKEFLFP